MDSSLILTGAKVRLCPKRWTDAFRDYRWARDPELCRLDATWPITVSLSDYLEGYADGLRQPSYGRYRFAMETLDGEHIGNCMYYDLDEARGQAEIGVLIGEPAYWGKGYGTDAVRVLLQHLFETVHLGLVYLHTLEWNRRAQGCFEKCGFIVQGKVQRNGFDFLAMELSREQWEKIAHPSAEKKLSADPKPPPAG